MTEKHFFEEKDIGRGNVEGAQMFRKWFTELPLAVERNDGNAVYAFCLGSLSEVVRCFDMPMIFPEINSLQTAVRHVAHEYLEIAEDDGYSPDICAYVKADYAVQIRGGEHIMGRIPKPTLAVLNNGCNTYIKWAEIWERMYKIPIFTLDLPSSRAQRSKNTPGTLDWARDQRYVAGQLRELIELCEQVSKRKFDIDRLREVLKHTNHMYAAWRRILQLNRSRPAVFNALNEGTIYMGVINAFRGTAEGARYFERVLEEMEYKAAHGIGTIENEVYRLLFAGVPCYPIFRNFTRMFHDRGGAFVNSTYLWFASGGADLGFQYDLDDPLESLAEGILTSMTYAIDGMIYLDELLETTIDPYSLDGIIFHPIKSCRTASSSMADARRALTATRDIPSLFIESDMMDRRAVSEAQMKNRIEAFFEGLDTRRLAGSPTRDRQRSAGSIER